MKRIILIWLLVLTVASTFSFTTLTNEIRSERPVFKRYMVVVNQTLPIQGSNCTVQVVFMVQFYWNGPGTPITNVSIISEPVAYLHCPPNGIVETKNSKIDVLDLSDNTGYVTSISFEPTGNSSIDDALSNDAFLSQIIADMNQQIDYQRE